MIKSYLKIAWRNISSRKFYTFLNIGGLTIAISSCILIYLYISYNLSFDTYHQQAGNIFRLVNEVHLDKTEYDKGSSFAEFSAVGAGIPQVGKSAFSVSNQSLVVNVEGDGKKRFKEENNISFTNSRWFKLFSYQWIAGGPDQLDETNNVVLRQKTANKYFGNSDPMGKVLLLNDKRFTVVGIIADAPYNTDLKSEIYLSFSSLLSQLPLYDKTFFTDWGYINSTNSAFVQLNNVNEQDAVQQEISVFEKRYMGEGALKVFKFKLLPLKNGHFDMRYGGVVQKTLFWTLGIIGILIMAIAVFNYINLTVARQTRRSAEIATRKVLGGTPKQIFMQFITESLMTSFIAVAAAIVLVKLVLPQANTYLFADEPVYIISYINLTLFCGLLLLLVTIGTGVYPALLLSRINIAQALKNNVLNLTAGTSRKVMVVFQNTITQLLIVCTIVIITQVHYLKNTDIGFNRKSVITIPIGQLTNSQKQQFIGSLRGMPAVQSFSFCNNAPSSDSQRGATVQFDNRPKWETQPARFAIGDSAYCRTFGLHIVAGRNIRSDIFPAREFLVNQTMASMLNSKNPDDVIGKPLTAGGEKGIITGIVKDFNIHSLSEPIEPVVLLQETEVQTNLAVKLSGRQTSLTLDELQKAYQHIVPDGVFSYHFIDEQIADLYKKESIQQKLIWLAAMIAIVISSLGLLGMVSLVAVQRTKEIGIRKILGATVAQISLMLSRDFLSMVVMAFVIASPVSFWIMNKWLQSFSYRINITWWMFVLAACVAVFMAMITIFFQSFKAANSNPVDSLRNE